MNIGGSAYPSILQKNLVFVTAFTSPAPDVPDVNEAVKNISLNGQREPKEQGPHVGLLRACSGAQQTCRGVLLERVTTNSAGPVT